MCVFRWPPQSVSNDDFFLACWGWPHFLLPELQLHYMLSFFVYMDDFFQDYCRVNAPVQGHMESLVPYATHILISVARGSSQIVAMQSYCCCTTY